MLSVRLDKQIENNRIKDKKEAISYFINNPVDTKIEELKAIQKLKSEKNIYGAIGGI